MKILVTHFSILDWGGLVNFTENMALGFKELGHDVMNVMLTTKGATGYPIVKNREGEEGWEYGPGLDMYRHQKKGWEGMYRFNYKENLKAWEEFADDFDLIVHQVPVPTCSKKTKGDKWWKGIYDIFPPQVVIVHDGNMQKLYPHLIEICDKIEGIACVHDAAYNSCEVLPVPRAMIHSPHIMLEKDVSDIEPPENRTDGFLSLQTFKRWKRVDDLIRAIPHMDELSEKVMAGGGIEYYYMTSKDKVKVCYLEEDGSRIWNNALDSGMEWLGYITTEERDDYLREMKLLVDPSWSKSYADKGSHFNRVMIEAMILGCVPVCTDLGMKNSLLFKAGENYIEVPYDCSPEEYAEILEDAFANNELLAKIQKNNFPVAERFSHTNTAKWLIELANGLPTGHLEKLETGETTEKLLTDAAKKMEHFK